MGGSYTVTQLFETLVNMVFPNIILKCSQLLQRMIRMYKTLKKKNDVEKSKR